MSNPENIDRAIDKFRELGIEPIVIDPNDNKSIEDGLKEVTKQIKEVKQANGNETT